MGYVTAEERTRLYFERHRKNRHSLPPMDFAIGSRVEDRNSGRRGTVCGLMTGEDGVIQHGVIWDDETFIDWIPKSPN